jgi:hypothetical protein
VSRATYYRWRSEDKKFKEESDKALKEGIEMINDMAESQLLSSIRDKNMTAIIFWLKNHHQSYIPKLEISSDQNQLRDDLTPDEEAIVREALLLSGVIKEKPIKENGKQKLLETIIGNPSVRQSVTFGSHYWFPYIFSSLLNETALPTGNFRLTENVDTKTLQLLPSVGQPNRP